VEALSLRFRFGERRASGTMIAAATSTSAAAARFHSTLLRIMRPKYAVAVAKQTDARRIIPVGSHETVPYSVGVSICRACSQANPGIARLGEGG
jgi:hypothetical protein